MSVLLRTFRKDKSTVSRVRRNNRWVSSAVVLSSEPRRGAVNPSGFEAMVGVLIALLVVLCVGVYFDHLDWVETRRKSVAAHPATILGAGVGASSAAIQVSTLPDQKGR